MSSKNTSLLDSQLREAAAYDPFLRGRFPVGVQTFEAHDEARDRRFPCEVWYPAAAEQAAQDVDPRIQDCFTPRLGNTEQRQSAVRDAATHAGTYPLILFSHHSGGHRRTSTFLCTHLSSHGYIVAALDHSEVMAPELAHPQNETEEQKDLRWQAVIESRVPDARFLIDQMLDSGAWNNNAEIDHDQVGLVGHSFGGATALATPECDERIKAVVALAPGGASNPRPGILPVKLTWQWGRAVPALFLAAENDVPLPLAGMYELFERAPEPKQLVILRRADHMHFVDDAEQAHEAFRTMSPVPPEVAEMQREMIPFAQLCSGERAHLWIRGLTLAHMDAFLKDQREAKQLLAGDIEGELAKRGVEVMVHRP
ncbi:MAG TPA: dienelactone hydrolase family protein [Candidatus Angelobacter sp.]|nr:dienelactone hydrolase family protein [Candidatus Angelobacter sp.]